MGAELGGWSCGCGRSFGPERTKCVSCGSPRPMAGAVEPTTSTCAGPGGGVPVAKPGQPDAEALEVARTAVALGSAFVALGLIYLALAGYFVWGGMTLPERSLIVYVVAALFGVVGSLGLVAGGLLHRAPSMPWAGAGCLGLAMAWIVYVWAMNAASSIPFLFATVWSVSKARRLSSLLDAIEVRRSVSGLRSSAAAALPTVRVEQAETFRVQLKKGQGPYSPTFVDWRFVGLVTGPPALWLLYKVLTAS